MLTKICPTCKTEFTTKYRTKLFCSVACKNKIHNDRHNNNKRSLRAVYTFTCPICEKPFRTRHPRQKICGEKRCKIRNQTINNKIRRAENKSVDPVRERKVIGYREFYNLVGSLSRKRGNPGLETYAENMDKIISEYFYKPLGE